MSLMGVYLTRLLAFHLNQGVVRASCLATLSFWLCLKILGEFGGVDSYVQLNSNTWLVYFYGSSFIGMSSKNWGTSQLILAATLYSLCSSYLVILPFIMLGGWLGFIAFLSLVFSKILTLDFKAAIAKKQSR